MADDTARLELVQQNITRVLQEIDRDFVDAHEIATKVLTQVKLYGQATHRIARTLKVWVDFFNDFNEAPEAQVLYQSTLASSASTAHSPTPKATSSSSTPSKQTPPQKQVVVDSKHSFNSPPISLSFVGRPRDLPPTPELGSPPRTTPFRKLGPGISLELSDVPSPPSLGSPPSTPFLDVRTYNAEADIVSEEVTSSSSRKRKAAESEAVEYFSPIGGQDWPRFNTSGTSAADLKLDLSMSTPNPKRQAGPRRLDDSLLDITADDGVAFVGFDLRKFPSVYQSGAAAEQLTQVYDCFFSGRHSSPDAKPVEQSMETLLSLLPKLGEPMIQLMVDLLASRKLIRASGLGKWNPTQS